jgi:hypothetical protein
MDEVERYLANVKRGMDAGTEAEQDAIIDGMRKSIIEKTKRLEARGWGHQSAVRWAMRLNSPYMFIPQLLGYLLCFILPSWGLCLLLPKLTPIIVAIAGILLFLMSGCVLGMQWRTFPSWMRLWLSSKSPFFIVIPALNGVRESMRTHEWRNLLISIAAGAGMLALLLSGFCLGKVIDRRRSTRKPGSEDGDG